MLKRTQPLGSVWTPTLLLSLEVVGPKLPRTGKKQAAVGWDLDRPFAASVSQHSSWDSSCNVCHVTLRIQRGARAYPTSMDIGTCTMTVGGTGSALGHSSTVPVSQVIGAWLILPPVVLPMILNHDLSYSESEVGRGVGLCCRAVVLGPRRLRVSCQDPRVRRRVTPAYLCIFYMPSVINALQVCSICPANGWWTGGAEKFDFCGIRHRPFNAPRGRRPVPCRGQPGSFWLHDCEVVFTVALVHQGVTQLLSEDACHHELKS